LDRPLILNNKKFKPFLGLYLIFVIVKYWIPEEEMLVGLKLGIHSMLLGGPIYLLYFVISEREK